MNPSEIMLQLATDIANDKPLQDWCLAAFGKKLTVQLGVDEDNPPEAKDYPICGIPDVVETRGDGLPMQSIEVQIACGLINKGMDTPLENLRVYSGLPQVADLKHRIEQACFRFVRGGVSVSGDSAEMSLYPLFVSYTTVSIKIPKSTRRALL